MTASRKSLFLSDVASNGPLSAGSLEYFRQRQRNRLYELVLTQFGKSGLTRAALARRLGCRPEQVTRWLRAPGNWKLDTVSDLLLAVSRSELDAKLSYPLEPVVEAEALSSKNEEQSDFKHDTVLDMSTPPANAAAPNALVSIAIAFVEQRPPGLASERAARRNRSEEPARRTAAPWIELGSNIADGAGGMNLVATDRGRYVVIFPIEEIRPLIGLSLSDLLTAVHERYGFWQYPDITDPEQTKNLLFRGGYIQRDDDRMELLELGIFSDGIFVEARTTELAEAAFHDFWDWAQSRFGFRELPASPRIRYNSQIMVEFESNIGKIRFLISC